MTRRANRVRVAPAAFGALALPLAVVLGAALPATLVLSGCGPEVVRVDRTEGRAMRLFWEDDAGERAAYYEVASDGLFRSGGGLAARDRRTTFRTALSDEEIAACMRLLDDAVRADAAADRDSHGAGGGLRVDLEFRDAASGWRATRATAPSAALLALRDWCAGVALRQFDATIEALPEAGSRLR